MDISIIVLTYNEETNIKDCLESILGQAYDKGKWEILIVDGGSTDNTINIAEEYRKKTDRIRIVFNGKREIASGRNLGIKESMYPFIAFTDADCIVPPDWLSNLSKEYNNLSINNRKVAGIGGGNIPPAGPSGFHTALGVYLDSFLGSFNSPQGRNFSKIKKVNTLSCSNVLYNKEILLAIRGFDEGMGNISEDFELNYRLTRAGYILFFMPGLTVTHKLRKNLKYWLKNMALYGRGRAIVTFKHNLFTNIFFTLPLCFFISMSLVPFGFINTAFFLPLLYFPGIAFYTLILTLKTKKLPLFFLTLTIFISTHFVYAFNLLIKSLKICYESVVN